MSALDLAELFGELPLPERKGTAFVARRLQGTDLRLARGCTGAPALLLPAGPNGQGIHLSNLKLTPRVACRVLQEDGIRTKQEVAVLECLSEDHDLHRYFLRLIATFVDGYRNEQGGAEAIEMAVRHIAELFRAIQLPGKTTLQGLWCELFILANASNRPAAIEAWHALPRDLYDFAERNQRLEVKSSSTGARSHRFSLEQLTPPSELKVVVASFLLSPGSGPSVLDLWQRIDSDLAPGLRRRVESQMCAALGSEWRNAGRVSFDAGDAARALKFYDAREIPRVDPAVPPGISEVRFLSDLTRAQAVDSMSLRAAGGLLEAVL